MPPQLHFLKPTFAGGEYAPSMYSRVDVQRYSTGARKLLNFIVHPHGGASNRPGWHYAADAKYASRQFRLHDFQFSSTQTYVLEFGHQYVRFFTNNGQIAVSSASAWMTATAYVVGNFVDNGGTIYYCIVAHTSGTFATDLANGDWVAQTVYEVPTPYDEDDLPYLNFTQSADVLFIFHKDFQTRQLNRLGNTNWTLTLYDFLYGPFMIANTTALTITPSAVTGSVTLTASAALFNSLHVGGLFQVNHNVAEQSVNSSLGSVAASSSISCGGTWRLITHGTWAGTITVQKSTDGGSSWTNVRTFSSASDFNANTFGTEDITTVPLFLVRLNMSAYTSGTCAFTLSADAFRNVGVTKVTAYTSSTQVTATVTRTLGGTAATTDWAEGSWSDYRGWPAVGEFNQDRLVTGNTASEPQTIWQTKASNYYDYSRSSPLVDSDAITTNLPARQLNSVNNFVPLTQLLALTSSSEWGIGAPDTAMSPLTIKQTPFGFDGSSSLKPVIVKNRAIYVQFMGGTVLDLGYELLSNTFTGGDISILANHLFRGYNIVDMWYQQYPDSILWMVRDDGVLLSLTYMREQEVIAWAHHETDGLVETGCSIPTSTYNQSWLGVLRGNKRTIEYMDNRMASTRPEDQFFVDSGITYDGTEPDSFVKLWMEFNGVNLASTFLDSLSTPKIITPVNNIYLSTAASKFGSSSGLFVNAGIDPLTKLLLHFDGVSGSQTVIDSELTPKTVTLNGNTYISNTQSKFGGTSLYLPQNIGIDSYTTLMLHLDNDVVDSALTPKTVTNTGVTFSSSTKQIGTYSAAFDGSTSELSLADSADFAFGTGNFTIDFWWNPSSVAAGQGFLFQGNAASNIQLFWDVDNKLHLFCPSSSITHKTCAFTPVVGTWYHIAFVRSGTTFYVFINGVSQTVVNNIDAASMPDYSSTVYVGSLDLGLFGYGVNGYLDEFRISTGSARWTTNFTPPSLPYNTGDYLSLADSADWNLAAGDFTIDLWAQFETASANSCLVSQFTDASNYMRFFWNTTNLVFQWEGGGSAITCTGAWVPTVDVWYHLAIVRFGNIFTLYVNGVSVGTTTDSDSLSDLAVALEIGRQGPGTPTSYFRGYIDELRFSKGVARWTTAFTPPSIAYYIPGYLTVPDSADFAFGTGNFTIDFWLNFNDFYAAGTVIGQYADANNYWEITKNLSGKKWQIKFVSAGSTKADYIMSSSWVASTATWYHIAVVRNSTSLKLYINGVSQTLTATTAISTNNVGDVASVLYIGQKGDTSKFLSAYVDELHVNKGVARWTANFTPPSVPGFNATANVISGLTHLEGKTVAILADGVVVTPQTVTGGQITLAVAAAKVHVGLPYISDLETLNIEVALPDGTMQGRKVKVSKVTLRVLNSKSGMMGPDGDHLKNINSVFADYRTETDLYTGDLKHTLGGGYSDGGRMFIRQTDPLPLTVLALMPLVSVAGTNMESN